MGEAREFLEKKADTQRAQPIKQSRKHGSNQEEPDRY